MLFELMMGIGLTLVGGIVYNCGIVIQKRQVKHLTYHAINSEAGVTWKVFFKNPLWLVGIIMQSFLYLPFVIFALDYIGITLQLPLSNACIVFLVLGLTLVLRETIQSRLELVGLCVLIGGIVVIALGGVVGNITMHVFLSSFTAFVIILSVIGGCSAASIVLLKTRPSARILALGVLAGNCQALIAIFMQLLTLALSELSHPLSILILIVSFALVVVFSAGSLYAIQEAFKAGKAIQVIPISQVPMNIFPVLAGLLVFQQVILNPACFFIGLACMIAGSSLLARYLAISSVNDRFFCFSCGLKLPLDGIYCPDCGEKIR